MSKSFEIYDGDITFMPTQYRLLLPAALKTIQFSSSNFPAFSTVQITLSFCIRKIYSHLFEVLNPVDPLNALIQVGDSKKNCGVTSDVW